ncbi:hypothetical protein HYALB_00000637 [Hymenoscyphus albidus]|uniref:ATP-dependent DNA helicase PIF1 n=1 Tax=Hymenoscyphus albidus TaxID=595503 RepID=A0A9N9LYP1_9HELO|nr:hypothetical protein HYALB_00000637 [Hymenoscyphus albidus]
MPTGLARVPAFSPAAATRARALIALRGGITIASACRGSIVRTPRSVITPLDARRPYSSIADAMLGRAVKDAGANAPPPKSTLEKQLFPSSSPAHDGNIQEQFKKASQSTQSIGGYTGYKNTINPSTTNAAKPFRARSPNSRPPMRQKSESTGSTMGASTLFNMSDSFQDSQSSATFSQDISKPAKQPVQNQIPVHFDENDFDDDIDLDMDFEMPTVMPMAAPPKPLSQKPMPKSPSPYNLPEAPRSDVSQSYQPPSSAVTWESSSPSHKLPPPRKRPAATAPPSVPKTTNEPDANTRPVKRRALPWLQKKSEQDEVAARMEEDGMIDLTSSPPTKMGKWGHTPKEKQMPWTTTGSAIRDQKQKLKDKQKATRKLDQSAAQAMGDHARSNVKITPISLSTEQERVKDLVVNQSKSVFFTGSAGTGKSVLMRAIIAELRKKYIREPDRVAVTASTGLAACNIGGVTLHSFSGIGLGKEDVPALVKKIKRNAKAKNRWLKTKILIIDEISMVDGDLFDKLEAIARSIRNNGRPFGGIQLVITGDFFQLPPVPEYDNKARGVKFAFDAGTWSTAIHHTIGLTEVFRQKDPVFANMLNEMRLGKISEETVKAFKKLNRKPAFEDSLEATELFPTRNEVENSNASRMRSLVGKSYRYDAVDGGTITDMAMRERLLSNMMAPKTMELKKGAQVMLIKNMDDGLVNGSLGKVIAFMSEVTFEIYDKNPEILEEGGMDALADEGRNQKTITARFSNNKDPNPNTGKEFPLVRFAVADGTVRDLLVMPEDWKIELPNGEVQAQRTQLPLILAWALSIHKAQGQTLERVKIDLKKIFEKGQAYVALSRAVSQEGLEVHNFDKSKVMAHPRVAQFYDSLYSVNKAMQHPTVAYPKSVSTTVPPFQKGAKGKVGQYADDEELMAAYR